MIQITEELAEKLKALIDRHVPLAALEAVEEFEKLTTQVTLDADEVKLLRAASGQLSLVPKTTGVVMQDVESGNVAAIGFDAEKEEIYVRFHNGKIYAYEATVEIWDEFRTAPSAGKFVHTGLKHQVYRVVDDAAARDMGLTPR